MRDIFTFIVIIWYIVISIICIVRLIKMNKELERINKKLSTELSKIKKDILKIK